MNPWIAKAVVLVSSVMMIVIRAPHGQRSRGLNVVKNRKGRLDRTSDVRVVRISPSPCLDYDAAARVRRLFASTWAIHRWSPVPCPGALALSPVTCGSRHELVGHTRGARKTSARHTRHLSPRSPSDVPVSVGLFLGPGARTSQLAGRTQLRPRDGPGVRLPSRARGADDAGGIRERLRNLSVTDEASRPRLVVVSLRIGYSMS